MSGAMSVLEMPPPPATLRRAYGAGESHFGDLRLPGGNGPFPLVMNIHGGFWRARYSLEHAGHLCAALAREGIATWNIEYRRLGNPGGGWHGTFDDVARAADALPALAREFPLALDSALVMGHSAGGHLALWAASRPAFPASHPLFTEGAFAFRGVVALAPVADLALAYDLRLSDGVTEELLGGSPATQPERYAQASPVALLPTRVPTILLHGTADEIVPVALSESYARAARATGDSCALERLHGAGHFELIDPLSAEWHAVLHAVTSLLSA